MKKLLALGLILILALSVFAGCASDNSGGDSGNAGDADNGNQGEKTTLIMGTNASFPPYEFY